MSVWLPRRSPSLLARHALNARSSVRLQAHAIPRLVVLRALNTTPPTNDTRDASAPSHTTPSSASKTSANADVNDDTNLDVPTAEPKNPPPPASKDISTQQAPLATRVWKKVKHEAQHYWHGSKLLVREVRISARLQWKLLHGESLTRRERRQVSTFRLCREGMLTC